MKKARIGVAGNLLIMESGMFPGIYRNYVNNDYIESVEKAGGIPIQLPVISDLDDVYAQLEGLDGLIMTGGSDIDPSLYGEEVSNDCGYIMHEVDVYDLSLIKAADALGIPVLGICKGLQVINVAFGGSLYQSQKAQVKGTLKHFQDAPRYDATHAITIEDSFLSSVLGNKTRVNSFHNQSIKDLGEHLTVTASAPDGIIEAIEKKEGTFMCGVQFHPEMMAKFDRQDMIALFSAFFKKCQEVSHEK